MKCYTILLFGNGLTFSGLIKNTALFCTFPDVSSNKKTLILLLDLFGYISCFDVSGKIQKLWLYVRPNTQRYQLCYTVDHMIGVHLTTDVH